MRRIYVGNLPWSVDDAALRSFFEEAGCRVAEDTDTDKGAVVLRDKETNRSKGFGFVTLADEESFQKAMSLNNTEMQGRPLHIDEARPRQDRNGDAPAREAAPAPKAEETEAPSEEPAEAEEAKDDEGDDEEDDDDDDSEDEDDDK